MTDNAAYRERVEAVIEAARDLVMKPGGLVNRGMDVGLVVVEKRDGSDPHARLCDAFKRLDAIPAQAITAISPSEGWRAGPLSDEHELKCWDPHFQDVLDGRKPFEVRKHDRCYRVGDILWLREWRPNTERYSGRECRVGVTHLLHGGQFGIEPGYCVLGITSPLPAPPGAAEPAGEALRAVASDALALFERYANEHEQKAMIAGWRGEVDCAEVVEASRAQAKTNHDIAARLRTALSATPPSAPSGLRVGLETALRLVNRSATQVYTSTGDLMRAECCIRTALAQLEESGR